MKKLAILAMSLGGFFFASKAAVITVSNNPQNPGQYTDLQLAMDDASNGDTILISGSNTLYQNPSIGSGDFTLRKQLVLIGAGYNPQNQFGMDVQLDRLYIDSISAGQNASGSVIMGLDFGYGVEVVNNKPIKNVTMTRNKFASTLSLRSNCDNWLIYNNYFTYNLDLNDASNVEVRNNIFVSELRYSASNTVVFANNLCISPYTGGNYNTFNDVQNALVANNIFYGRLTNADNDGKAYNCTFNNNIVYGNTNNTATEGNNSGGGNFDSTDPVFVISVIGNYQFDLAGDYHLDTGSPGLSAGTDGTDIGIYGGLYPWPEDEPVPNQYSIMPRIPQVLEMNVQNSVVPVNGTLNVQIKARKQQ